jgi:hypothetical protein
LLIINKRKLKIWYKSALGGDAATRMFVLNFDDIDKRNQAVDHLCAIGCTLTTVPTASQHPPPPIYPSPPISFSQSKPKGSSQPTSGSQGGAISERFPVPIMKVFPPPFVPPPHTLPLPLQSMSANLPPFQLLAGNSGHSGDKQPAISELNHQDDDDSMTIVAPEDEEASGRGNANTASLQLVHIQAIVKTIMDGVATMGGREVTGKRSALIVADSACQTDSISPPLSFETLIDMVKSGYADPEIESLLFDDADGFDQLVLTVAERMGIPKKES